MYRENYKNSLEKELYEIVQDRLTPVALKYNYSETPLESNIAWQPVVLITGNYSSGKSTLINEYLGAEIQKTGQAPTDDSFTVLTFDGSTEEPVGVVEEHDGRYLLNDPEYPFEKLKKYGQRFASHICLKKVNSPFLKNLAIIDTPGMLDSISEKDRGYNYQAVIGDLARVADLVLVLFDPHKAGTVQEAYVALRETLPANTFEERILFVLNRVDECTSMADLLKVYGTLCWNLSQMTGRKDIPPIHLTYSKKISGKPEDSEFLQYLNNEQGSLRDSILKAPDYRLEHLATFVETHSENLDHMLEALIAYGRTRSIFNIKFFLFTILCFFLSGAATILGLGVAGLSPGALTVELLGIATGVFLFFFLIFVSGTRRFFIKRFHRKQVDTPEKLTSLDTQRRKDSWATVENRVVSYLEAKNGKVSLRTLKKDYAVAGSISVEGTKEIRDALKELSLIPDDEPEADVSDGREPDLKTQESET